MRVQFEIGVVFYKMGRSKPTSAEKLKCWGKALRIWKEIEEEQDDEADLLERRNRRKAKNAWLRLRADYVALENQLNSYPSLLPSEDLREKGSYTKERLSALEEEAINFFRNEEYITALSIFEILSANAFNERSTLVYLALAFLREGEEPEKAVVNFRAYIDRWGETAFILQKLGQAYGLCADSFNQIKYLKKSLVFQAEPPAPSSEKRVILNGEKAAPHIENALPHILTTVKAPVDKGYVHILLAQAYDSISDIPKTMEHSKKAIEINPANKPILIDLLKGSNTIEVITRLIGGIMNSSEDGRPSDGMVTQFTDEISQILGEDELNFDGFREKDYKERDY
jgi:tetratricopeptide (TPR) repeat protein